MATQLHEPVVARSGSSVHSREEDDFNQQSEENPLEVVSTHQSGQQQPQPQPPQQQQPEPTPTPTVASPIPPTPTGGSTNSSILPTPSVLVRQQSPLAVQVAGHEPDEPPPPYEELASQLAGTPGDAPQIAPIEYSVDNSPQLLHRPDPEFPAVPPRNPDRPESQVGVSPLHSPNAPASPVDSAALPSPLQPRAPPSHPVSSEGSVRSQPAHAPSSPPSTTFSSAKAREAGFEIETPAEQHPVHRNSTSSSSLAPSVTILSAADALKHVREPGKVMAYLIPFPKPRLKGIKPEDIPERFLIYTPPLPPSMKPVSNDNSNQAAKGKGPKVTWKTRTASFFNKGLNMTRSTNVEFLDRVSRGSVTAAEKELPPESANLVSETPTPPPADPDALPPYSRHAPSIAPSIAPSTVTSIAPSDSASQVRSNHTLYRDASLAPASAAPSVAPPHSPSAPPSGGGAFFSAFVMTPSAAASSVPSRPARSDTTTSMDSDPKESKPKQQELEELTLIYPPSLELSPDKIRTEFVDTLMRTRESSRRKALVASALLPFAATIDSCLVITFGGLTQMSGAWAYTNTQGALASSKISKGLARGEAEAHSHDHPETETHGCTCGHHEHDFGAPETVPKSPKNKKPSINLQLQQSGRLEVLRRYLDLACFKKEFNLFPQIIETAGDVTEPMVLEAIGWKPSNVGETQHPRGELPGDDELWQVEEAEVDVKRYMKKGAVEWVEWCKKFQKDFLKDPEAAVKK